MQFAKQCAVVLILSCESSAAEKAGWMVSLETFHALRAEGKHQESAAFLARSLPAEPSPAGHAHLSYWLAVVYHDLGQYDRAERFYKRSAAEVSALPERGEASAAIPLSDLAALYLDMRRPELALDAVERAMEVHRRESTGVPPKAIHVRARILAELGRNREAEEGLRQVLDRLASPETPETAAVLNNLATLLTRQGRYQESLGFLERAARIIASAGPSAGSQLPRILINLAESQHRAGNNLAADRHCLEAAALVERLFGADHPDLAYVLAFHAEVLKDLGRKQEAKLVRRRVESLTRSLRQPATVDWVELGRRR